MRGPHLSSPSVSRFDWLPLERMSDQFLLDDPAADLSAQRWQLVYPDRISALCFDFSG